MGVTPQALRDRPTLKAHLRPHLEAFYELSAGRSYGEMNGLPHPIPAAEILGYCELLRINSQAERERLFRMVRRLDAVFVTQMLKKAEKPKKP